MGTYQPLLKYQHMVQWCIQKEEGKEEGSDGDRGREGRRKRKQEEEEEVLMDEDEEVIEEKEEGGRGRKKRKWWKKRRGKRRRGSVPKIDIDILLGLVRRSNTTAGYNGEVFRGDKSWFSSRRFICTEQHMLREIPQVESPVKLKGPSKQ
ncbi:hypothetical protein BHE74_00040360 [Ensete ventricosum]|nr:hypothetical protein BHE74_00040360 [Ensete ventricosum]RZR84991.1 hypothetical protein BHM03_00011912 [Ensete ventricosum]